ncbi:MAG: hypothetical protein ACI39Q_00140 [Wujia sp.]
MVIITGFLLGLFFASCLAALCTYFLFRCYGYFLCYMQIFHHRFSKNKRDDTVHHTKTSFLPACCICMTKEDMSDQASISQGIIYTLVLLLVLFGCSALIIFLYPHKTELARDSFYTFFFGSAIGMIIYGISWGSNILLIYVSRSSALKKDNPAGFINRTIKSYLYNFPTEQMYLPEPERIGRNISLPEILSYQNIRFIQQISLHAYQKVEPIVSFMENYVTESAIDSQYNSFYNILFYYCRIQCDFKKATYYYTILERRLEVDLSCTGRRVLAYYQYFILQNPYLARQTARQGVEALFQTSTSAQRIYERELLTGLISNIDTYFPSIQSDN